MSNKRKLTTIHGNGAFPSRPKSQWRGYRRPRSRRAQWELQQAYERMSAMAPLLNIVNKLGKDNSDA